MTICFPDRDLPVLDSCDVLVVDCSLAGMAAAVRLASRGLSVAVVEPRTYPAREMTAKGRTWIDCAEVAGCALPEPLATAFAASREDERDGVWPLHQDRFKLALEDCLRTADVRLWYASLPVGVLQGAAGAVAGIVVGNKSGRQAIRCGWVIDTSETALAARLLGAEFEPEAGPSRVVRRIEFTGVEGLEEPVFEWHVPGTGTLELQAFPGNGGNGHVNIEYASVHAVGASDAVSATARDLAARRVGVSLVESLKSGHPAFADALWAGSSHEVEGGVSPPAWLSDRFRKRVPKSGFLQLRFRKAATLDAACFLTGVPGRGMPQRCGLPARRCRPCAAAPGCGEPNWCSGCRFGCRAEIHSGTRRFDANLHRRYRDCRDGTTGSPARGGVRHRPCPGSPPPGTGRGRFGDCRRWHVGRHRLRGVGDVRPAKPSWWT